MKRDFKVGFDGAYKVEFDGRIDWRDHRSTYAASYARLADGSLIYLAERLGNTWSYGLWNPNWTWMCASLRDCRHKIRRDFKERMVAEGLNARGGGKALHFANMQWGTNYAHRREQDYLNDMLERYGIGNPNELLDYAVYLVYSNVHEQQKVVYVVERIGGNWLGNRWDGASDIAGRNLRECQVAIWKHMTEWCKSSEYTARLRKELCSNLVYGG